MIWMTAVSTLLSKGQTVIPVEIRRQLGAKPGDQIVFKVVGDTVTLRVSSRKPLTSLIGVLPAASEYTDLADIRKKAYASKSQSKFTARKNDLE